MLATKPTPELEIVAEDTFLVKVPNLEEEIGKLDKWCWETHSASGLLVEHMNASVPKEEDPAARIVRFLDMNGCCFATNEGTYRSPICGSTPSFDRAFLKAKWPHVEKKLSHRHIDVSSFLQVAKAWYTISPESEPPHRAMADIKRSREALLWLKRHVFTPYNRQGTGFVKLVES